MDIDGLGFVIGTVVLCAVIYFASTIVAKRMRK